MLLLLNHTCRLLCRTLPSKYCPRNLRPVPTPHLLLAAAPVGLRGVTAGGSVTAVSATTVVVGRSIVVRVVVTTVGVGVFLFGNVEYDRVGRAVHK